MKNDSSTRWALVTGASSGIGQRIAVRLAEAGYSVFVNHYRDESGASKTLAQITASGQQGVLVDADVGNAEEVERMFEAVAERGEGLELMVNNAGVQTWASLLDLDEKDWDRTIRTNLKGTFLCSQRAGRLMVQQRRGSIVNIGSGANRIPFPKLSDYCASKGGIEMLTRCAAIELGPQGVRVNCVAPGAIENERTRAENPDYAATWGGITPLRRCGTADDVANTVLYLASEAASFVTGQSLFVDGRALDGESMAVPRRLIRFNNSVRPL